MVLLGPSGSGKSTLVNRILGRREAVVQDVPGVTRDRNYGICRQIDGRPFVLVDTGGLTGALAMRDEARRLGLHVMVGCMVGTSLGMAPALLLAQHAAWVDVDGPLLLAQDRAHGLHYEGGTVFPPEPQLWG